MFSNTSNFNYGVDLAFWIIMGISLVFLIGLTAFILFIVIRYRKEKHPKAVQIKDNTALEITWTVIPIILVLFMFYIGYRGFIPMLNIPKDAMEVELTARKWDWHFKYGNGKESNELFVPVHKSIKLKMRSLDVIHGFFVPAFTLKQDVVPGYTTYSWFNANEEGTYDIYCSLYCGMNHSFMSSKVHVMQADSFNLWLATSSPQADTSFAQGLDVIKNNGCTGCHSTNGTILVSSSFKDLYGSQRTVETDGKEHAVLADDAYIKKSVYDPNKDIAKGYSRGIMRSYKDKISEEEMMKLTEYLKYIGRK